MCHDVSHKRCALVSEGPKLAILCKGGLHKMKCPNAFLPIANLLRYKLNIYWLLGLTPKSVATAKHACIKPLFLFLFLGLSFRGYHFHFMKEVNRGYMQAPIGTFWGQNRNFGIPTGDFSQKAVFLGPRKYRFWQKCRSGIRTLKTGCNRFWLSNTL